MADKPVIFFLRRMENLNRIIKLQAYFRGTLVRKRLCDVRKAYAALVQELDKNLATHVTWPSDRLCQPNVEKVSKKKVTEKVLLTNNVDKNKTEKVVEKSSIQNDNLIPHEQNEAEVERLHREKTLSNDLEQTENTCFHGPILREEITHERSIKFKYNSVETQTKFSSDEESNKSPTEELDFYPVRNCKLIQTEEPTDYDNAEIHQRTKVSSRTGLDNSDLNNFNFNSLAEENQPLSLNVVQKKDIALDKKPVSPVRENHSSEDDSPQERWPTRTKSPTFRPSNELQSGGFQVADTGNISTFTNVTSLWESFNSVQDCERSFSSMNRIKSVLRNRLSQRVLNYLITISTEGQPLKDFNCDVAVSLYGSAIHPKTSLPQDVNELQELRKNVAMELLWVHQAINSRKNYLRLKNEMKDSVAG